MSEIKPIPIEDKQMYILSEKSPAELGAMTKAQLIAAALDGVTHTTAVNEYEGDVLIGQVQTTKNAYEVLVGTLTMEFTYYPTGEVDVITITLRDDEGEITETYDIKHPLGGQPYIVDNGVQDGQMER